MTYPAYEQYKDSGIPWLGQVPEGWELKRLRYLINMNPSAGEITLADDAEVSFVPMEAVQELGGIDLSSNKKIADIGSGYTYFSESDIVVAKITPCFENWKGSKAIGLTNGVAFGTTELHVLRAQKNLDSSFLFYLTLTDPFRKIGESEMYGAGGQKRVPENFFKNYRVWTPPLPEQRAIAAFLDRKTAEIDALIGKKEGLLGLMEEKRTATITHAVTKGLNPTATLKPSGIPWLGDIPEHWDNASLRHISRRYAGGTPSKEITEYWTDGTIPWLNSGTVNQFIITEPSAYITDEAYANSSAKWVPKGALLMALAGQGKTKGMVAETIFDTTCNQSMAAIVWDKNQHVRFMLYYLNAQYSKIRGLASVDARDGLNLEMIGGIPCPVPPISEQKEIAAYLDTKTAEIDAAKNKITAAIERLREYRTALITHAVTGKIKVV